ncbi:MAG: hypothetical protein E7587_00560 [Ruminococcaceae bacterium]|nr:hypothetical protein [Oscillospiraceae bacterium]
MLKKTRISYSVSLILSILSAIAAAVIRTYLLFSEYDPALGHFAPDSALNTAFGALIVTSAVFFITPCIFIMKEKTLRTVYTDLPTVFSASFLSVVLVLFSVFVLIETFGSEKVGAAFIFSLLSALFALLSVPYYVLRICNANIKSETYSALSFFPVLLGCALAFSFYFDNTMYMNSPVQILHQISAIFITFFSLGECRITLNRVLWGLYTFVGLNAFVLTLADSLPLIIYMPKAESVTYGNIASYFLVFAFSLYIISRIFSVYSLNSKNARSLISFFKKSYDTKKEEEAAFQPEAEQLHIDIDGNESNAQSEQK